MTLLVVDMCKLQKTLCWVLLRICVLVSSVRTSTLIAAIAGTAVTIVNAVACHLGVFYPDDKTETLHFGNLCCTEYLCVDMGVHLLRCCNSEELGIVLNCMV